MAIEKKLICFARLEEFERQLAAGNILDYSIVFIQDAKKIWNRGTYYDCSGQYYAEVYGDTYIDTSVEGTEVYLTTNVAENLDAVSARGQLADAYDVKTFVEDSYVKKETGKGLSTQDFTTELEAKLKGIEANAQKNVQSDWSESDMGSDAYVNNRTHYSYDIEQVASFSIASKNEGDILVTGLYDGVFYRIINNAGGKSEFFHFVEGRKVVIPSNGPTIEVVCAYEDDYCLKLTTPTYGMTESFVLKEIYVEQLDDVYIPETIARKAEIATINGQSILGSGNISISGGSGGGSGAYAEVNHGTSDTTFTLTPNTFHVWDEVASLTLTLGSETSGVANEYIFQFTSGSTPTSLTLPDDIKWANDSAPTIAENMIYQVSVLKGLASVLEFSNAIEKRENFIDGVTGSYLISAQYPVASDITIEYWDNFYDDTYTVTMLAGTSEVSTPERFGGIENLSPKEDGQFYYLYYD